MATGIALPVTVDNGRFKLLSKQAYISQLLMIAFGDGDSENPFQDIALGEFMIFAINDASPEGEIRKRVEQVFKSLEDDQLAKLTRGSQSITFVQEDQTKTMYLDYTDLETGEREDMEYPLEKAT